METPQDGIIVLVVSAQVFYQLLTHVLKTKKTKLKQVYALIIGCCLRHRDNTKNIPLNERRPSTDSLVPEVPASQHICEKHTG